MTTTTRSGPLRLRMRATLAGVAVAGLIMGCGGDDTTGPPPQPQPQPGELRVTLSSGTAVGAVTLTVNGTGITSPAPSGGVQLYHDLSGGTLRAVVAGSSLSGEILTFSVPDVGQVANYQVSVQQAAGTANQTLGVGGLSVSVVR